MSYTVFIDENSRYQDREARYKHGEFESYEAAVEACMTIVDEYLDSAYKEGMSAKELYESWSMFGEDPFIVPVMECGFSAQAYVKKRCAELGGE